MAENFIQRAAKPMTITTADGKRRVIERSDITISLTKDGEYRCFKCPLAPGGGGDHFVTRDPAEAALHAADHMIAGQVVPAAGLERLAARALRDA